MSTPDGTCISDSLVMERKGMGSLNIHPSYFNWTSLVAQMVKCLPAMQEIQIPSPGWVDPKEKEMATHSGTLAWKIP